MAKSPERPEMGSVDKDALLARAEKGDSDAQEAIFRDYAPRLMAVAGDYKIKPEDAEEIVSTCFTEAFKNISQIYPRQNFYTLMHRMVVNRIIDRMRSNRVMEQNTADIALLGRTPEVEDPETQLVRSQDKDFVNELLARMEPQNARLLFLREFDNLSYKEMSNELGISEDEAMTGYKAARKQFEQMAHEEKGRFE